MALITITSKYGSGGIDVARLVSERLGIQLYDNSKLREMISTVGMSSKDLEGLDEKSPGLLDRLFNNKPGLYMDLLGSTVYDIASKGEGVVVGHGAQFFLKEFNCAFHVMIHASEQSRINRIIQEKNIDESSATKIINKMDRRINSFVHYAFNRDMNDVSMYDIVINLDKIERTLAVNTIADISQSETIKSCSLKSLEQMQYTSLQRKIDAELIKHNITSPFTQVFVDVSMTGDVHLTGTTFSEEEKRKISEITKNVPGVNIVNSDLLVNEYYD